MNGELRIPIRLIAEALQRKITKALRLFASAKLQGHRSDLKPLCECLKIKPRTCSRLAKKIVADGWAGYDGHFLFPRAWSKLNLSKYGGLYITTAPKNLNRFEALCFAMALKRLYRKLGSPHSTKRRVAQTDFPARYLSRLLGLSNRRFERLKSSAQRYGYISIKRQFKIVGKATDYEALKKNLKGIPLFKRNKVTVTPDVSKIRVLI